jgi:hypothetical protein
VPFFYSNFWEVKNFSLLQARLFNLLLYYPLSLLAVFTDRKWGFKGERAVGRSGGRVWDLRTYLPVAPLSSGVSVSRLPRVGWQADAVGLPAGRTVDAAVVSRPRFRTNSFPPLPVRHSFSVCLSLRFSAWFLSVFRCCKAGLVRFGSVCLFGGFFFPFFKLFLHVAFCFVCPFLRWLKLSCCCCWFLVPRLGAAGTYVVTLRKRREENCACWSIMHVEEEEGEGRRNFRRSDWLMEDG